MAGNSARKGAIRAKSGGNPAVGSGGKRRKALEGRGPTPKAVERPNHKAHKRVNGARAGGAQGADRTRQPGPRRSRDQGGPDWVAGRNPVVEALRANVPVTTLFVAEHIERDDRVREIFDIDGVTGTQAIVVLETFFERPLDPREPPDSSDSRSKQRFDARRRQPMGRAGP